MLRHQLESKSIEERESLVTTYGTYKEERESLVTTYGTYEGPFRRSQRSTQVAIKKLSRL
jgi:hypothetical protein